MSSRNYKRRRTMKMLKCSICGKEIKESMYMNKILCSSECFHKDYWLDTIKMYESGEKYIISNGVLYKDWGSVTNPETYRGPLGHSGRVFKIRMKDTGNEFTTNNLWCAGEIPEEFRDLLPDNAEVTEV